MILQRSIGYSNLTHHIHSKHDEHIQDRKSASLARKQLVSSALSFQARTGAAHAWIEAVVLCLQPFSFVENRIMRKHFNHENISVDSLMKYMHLLTKLVESHIGTMLPDKFCVVFDGWAGGDTHYVAVFATFTSNMPFGFNYELLALAPMGDEDSLNAAEHFEFLEFVLDVYGKKFSNVAALVGDK